MSREKFREVVVRPSVRLPAISTQRPEREFSFLEFVREWVLGATSRSIRDDANLPHFFEWQDALEELDARIARDPEVGVAPVVAEGEPAPIPPEPPAAGTAQDSLEMSTFQAKVQAFGQAMQRRAAEEAKRQREYEEALGEWRRKVDARAVGEKLYLSDSAFGAGRESAKRALDLASTMRGDGSVGIDPRYETKVLRHYHAMTMSKAVEEGDVPRRPEQSESRPAN